MDMWLTFEGNFPPLSGDRDNMKQSLDSASNLQQANSCRRKRSEID